jgi:DNA (cytosine-5)-methyltransferase 1
MAGAGPGVDDNTAQGGHLVPVAAPFLATTITARESKGPDSDLTSGNLVGFDAAQITSGENRSNPQPGDPQPPLVATGAPHVAYALRDAHAGIGQGHNTNYVPLGGQGMRDLTAEGADASEDGTGRGTPIVAFAHKNSVGPGAGSELTGSVRAQGGQGGGAIAFGHTNGLDEQASGSATPTLRAGHGVGGGSVMTPDVTAAAVRRLTPVECERLQGYPDGWTATSGGREQSDSARYRQLGNSIAVPVFAWVARRLTAEHRSTP